MRYLLVIATVAMFLGAPPPLLAADTFEGEILDMACYIPKGAKGPSHARCAKTCAERGMPLGLLADDGTVYLLFPKHGKEKAFDNVKALAGERAKLTANASERAGIKALEVTDAAGAD